MRTSWRRVKEIFDVAADLDEGARTRYLEKACGQDARLREEVELLLAADRGDDSVFDQPVEEQLNQLTADWDRASELQGKTLAHYDVRDKLGQGGMGKVFLAQDSRLGRDIALKLLPPEMSSVHRLEQFRREARALAALNHPGIVQVYAIEEADDLHFITMELVRGEPLGEIIPDVGFSDGRFFSIALPLVDAVLAAHGQGIVHRDLKPDNIMVQPDGVVKVLDFGLAKVAASGASSPAGQKAAPSTSSLGTGIAGTLPYMSPEQLLGRPADARSDIFALGVIFYQMLSGRLPFDSEGQPELMAQILDCAPEPLAESSPSVPAALANVVHRCLRRDPAERFQGGDALRDALLAARDGEATALIDETSLKRPLVKAAWLCGVANLPLFIVLAAHWPRWDVALVTILQTKPAQYLFLIALFPFVAFFAELGVSDFLEWRARKRRREKSVVKAGLLELRRAMAVAGLVFGLVLALASAKTIHGLEFLNPPTARRALAASETILDAIRDEPPAALMVRLRREATAMDVEIAEAIDATNPETVREIELGIQELAVEGTQAARKLETNVRQVETSTLESSVFGAMMFTQFAMSERLNLDGIGGLQRALWWANLVTVIVTVYVGVLLLFATTGLMASRGEAASADGAVPSSWSVVYLLAFAGVVLSVWPGLRVYTVIEADLIYPEGLGPDLWIPYTVYLFCFTQAVPALLAARRENAALKAILALILLLSGFLMLAGDQMFFTTRTYLGSGSTVQDTAVSLVTIVGFLGSVSYWIVSMRSSAIRNAL